MKQLFDSLEQLLAHMDGIAAELEAIMEQERDAVRLFDGDMLVALVERRAVCQQALAKLEAKSRALLIAGGAPEAMNLEAFIDLHAGQATSRFQALRRALYERMSHLEKSNVENYIRMHAAFDVSTAILQQIGVVESKQTYGPRK